MIKRHREDILSPCGIVYRLSKQFLSPRLQHLAVCSPFSHVVSCHVEAGFAFGPSGCVLNLIRGVVIS